MTLLGSITLYYVRQDKVEKTHLAQQIESLHGKFQAQAQVVELQNSKVATEAIHEALAPPAPPTFPDMTGNYQKTVVIPAQEAAEAARKAAEDAAAAQQAELAAQAAQAVQIAPQPVLAPVSMSDAKLFIYMHESGNNPSSVNRSSGACGLGQALPCSKMPCSLGDYGCQDAFFTQYMLGRYGSWENARAWWLAHSWW